jgi:hypothetical protein
MDNIEKLKEKVARDPSSTLFVPLAEMYRKAGRIDEAIEVLRDGIDRQPAYASARVALGKIYFDRGMLAESREQFKRVVEDLPENLYAQKKLGEICKKQGDVPAAIAAYVQVQKLNPSDDEATVALRELQTMKGMKPRGDAAPAVAAGLGLSGRDLDATQALDPSEIVFDDEAFAAVFKDGADEEVEVVGVDEEALAISRRETSGPRSSISDDEVANLLGEISVSDDEVAVVGGDEDEGVDLAEEFGAASATARDDGLSLDETVSLGLSLSEREALTLREGDEEQPATYDLSEDEGVSSGMDESSTFSLSLAERAEFGDEGESPDLPDEGETGAPATADEDFSLNLSLAGAMAASEEDVSGEDEGEEAHEEPGAEEEATFGETVRMPSPTVLPRKVPKAAEEVQPSIEGTPPPFSLSLAEKAAFEADEMEEGHGLPGGEGGAEETSSIEDLISRAPKRRESIEELASSFSLSLAEKDVAGSFDEESETEEAGAGEEALFEPTSLGEEGGNEESANIPPEEAALFEPTSLGSGDEAEAAEAVPFEEAALFEPTSLGGGDEAEAAEAVPFEEAALFEPTSLGGGDEAEVAGEVPSGEASLFESMSHEAEGSEAAISESESSEVEAALFESASLDDEEDEGITLEGLPEEKAEEAGPRVVPEEEKTQEIEAVSPVEASGKRPYPSEKEPTEELLEPLVGEEAGEVVAAAEQEEEEVSAPDAEDAVIAEPEPAEVREEMPQAFVDEEVSVETEEEEVEGPLAVLDEVEAVEAEEYEGEVIDGEVVEAEIVEVEVEEGEAVGLEGAEYAEAEVPEESGAAVEPLAVEEVAEEAPVGEMEEAEVLVAEVYEGDTMDAEVVEAEVVEFEEYTAAYEEGPVEDALAGEDLGREAEAVDEDMFVPGGIEIGASPVGEMVDEAGEMGVDEDFLTPGAIEIDAEIEPEGGGDLLGEELAIEEASYEPEAVVAVPAIAEAEGAPGEYIERVEEAVPLGVEGGLREADALIAGGDYRGAAQVYIDLLRNDPENKEVRQRVEELGILARMMGVDIEPRRGVEQMLRDFLGAIEKRRNEFYRLA